MIKTIGHFNGTQWFSLDKKSDFLPRGEAADTCLVVAITLSPLHTLRRVILMTIILAVRRENFKNILNFPCPRQNDTNFAEMTKRLFTLFPAWT